MPPASLRLADYSDRELLHIVEDIAATAEDGWAPVAAIAVQVGLIHDRPNQCVGARLSWLARYDLVERHDLGGAWRATDVGHALMHGKLTATQQAELEKMEAARLLLVARALTDRQREDMNAPAYHAIRREWTHGMTRNY